METPYYKMIGADTPEWAAMGLPDFADFADDITYFAQREIQDEQIEGSWYYADDNRMTIFTGTFGNDNSPGASRYTFAIIFNSLDGYTSARSVYETLKEWENDNDVD